MKTLSTKPKQRKSGRKRENNSVKQDPRPLTMSLSKLELLKGDEMPLRSPESEVDKTRYSNSELPISIIIPVGNAPSLAVIHSKISEISLRYGVNARIGFFCPIPADDPLCAGEYDISDAQNHMDSLNFQSSIVVQCKDGALLHDLSDNIGIFCDNYGFNMYTMKTRPNLKIPV
jgi:hypothetical protein